MIYRSSGKIHLAKFSIIQPKIFSSFKVIDENLMGDFFDTLIISSMISSLN